MKITDIPYDLEELLNEDEICCEIFSNAFDTAMLENGFFVVGSTRRNHRIITDKAKKLSLNEIRAALLDISTADLKKQDKINLRRQETEEMFRIAAKYGFEVQ